MAGRNAACTNSTLRRLLSAYPAILRLKTSISTTRQVTQSRAGRFVISPPQPIRPTDPELSPHKVRWRLRPKFQAGCPTGGDARQPVLAGNWILPRASPYEFEHTRGIETVSGANEAIALAMIPLSIRSNCRRNCTSSARSLLPKTTPPGTLVALGLLHARSHRIGRGRHSLRHIVHAELTDVHRSPFACGPAART